MARDLDRQIELLNNLIKDTESATGESIELMSHWAKYICIIASGLLENAIKDTYTEFVISASSKPVADYAIYMLAKIQNPKSVKFIEIASKFKSVWAIDLKHYLDEDGRGDAIDSIMINRHLIAHGKSSNITMARVKEYLQKSIDVINYIKLQTLT